MIFLRTCGLSFQRARLHGDMYRCTYPWCRLLAHQLIAATTAGNSPIHPVWLRHACITPPTPFVRSDDVATAPEAETKPSARRVYIGDFDLVRRVPPVRTARKSLAAVFKNFQINDAWPNVIIGQKHQWNHNQTIL
jgi:hypothetical protein